jgi:4-hydroxy-tetrahydrodipicolinate synthase
MFRQRKACPEPVEWIESNSPARAWPIANTTAKPIAITFRTDRINRPLCSANATDAIARGYSQLSTTGTFGFVSAMPEIKTLPPDQSIRGVLAPVVTPFKADLSPDRERLIAHCRWLLSQNCGVAPFGTTSEANSMSIEERMTLLDALVAARIDPRRMMPGTGCCSITETVELTAQAVRQSCAGVLMLPPFYYKSVSEEGLYRYFSEVVQRVGDSRLKIYLYHIPPVAVVGITPKLVERLLKVYPSAIAGMKDSSGDWNNTKTFLDAFVENAHRAPTVCAPRTFDLFVGSESFLLANMRNGGAGTISATANVNPAAIHKLYAEWNTADDADNADQKQSKLDVVRDIFSDRKFPSMIAALKQAIAIYRNDAEWTRLRPPLVELTTEQAELLAAELKSIGFGMSGLGTL